MKHIVMMLVVIGCLGMSAVSQAEEVKSLRGHTDIDADSTPSTNKKWMHDTKPLARQYVQQPPLIPHKIKNYKINLRNNKCLTCHSWKNARISGATKISLTHFTNRDGVELSNVSPRRYFCNQCHVPQVDAKPLVENVFEPTESLQ
ncbi:MAG: nitrate reductase cytochrome c-type subunit [Methylococcales bacterium]|jgi:nitrate reductase (cytochrome), electron transfer subunit|nr:nitrate reductase cytochrome c-type subunit [Methylococcales bacterium]MBT7443583.1 nitrate reductase cytochrome c-type subunit [Methylococcales bacterium]